MVRHAGLRSTTATSVVRARGRSLIAIVRVTFGCTACAGVALGCAHDPAAPAAPHTTSPTRVDASWVTGAAARQVDPATGLFVLVAPAARYVSRSAAESVAVAVARFYGDPTLQGNGVAALEQDHGGPVAFTVLAPCGRATYVVGPIGELPPEAPGSARRAFGPQWAVPLCAPGTAGAQLSVGVPDGPRDLVVVGTTLVGWRQFGGGRDFRAVGVPTRFPSGLPLPPEDAVAYAVRATGRRVAEVPAAYDQWQGSAGNFPLCASWRLTLETAARFVGDSSGRAYESATVYVRPPGACFAADARLYLPLADQPATQPVLIPHDTTGRSPGWPDPLDTLQMPVARAIRFEPVTSVR